MSKWVHLKVKFYKPEGKRQTHVIHKTDAKTWDQRSRNEKHSFLNGIIMRAGGMGSTLYSVQETKRTKT